MSAGMGRLGRFGAIIRIVPDEEQCPAGYLCSFLVSSLGQVQLTANIHGAVVDELTDEQLRSVVVPLPKTTKDKALLRSVDDAMKKSTELKSQAVASAEASAGELVERFGAQRRETRRPRAIVAKTGA